MELMERMQGLIEKNQLGMLRMRLEALNAPDVAELMEACTRERALLIFRLLPKERAADTFAYLAPEKQQAAGRQPPSSRILARRRWVSIFANATTTLSVMTTSRCLIWRAASVKDRHAVC